MTLKEIAALAGVSPSTVSRVINHSKENAASKAVQDKIWQVVRDNDYTPNSAARTLRMGGCEDTPAVKGKTIACIFARSADSLNSPFFTQIARAVEREAFHNGYTMKYSISAYDLKESSSCQLITDSQVDGVVVLGRFDKNLVDFIMKHYKYVVYTGLNDLDAKFDRIICNGYQISIAAVQYLIKLGHTKIAYIGERTKESRYRGYCEALQLNQLPFNRKLIVDVKQSPDGGYAGAKELLKRGEAFTAIFCANDSTAIGVMKAVKEEGRSIPEDVSIIGIDDIETAQYLTPMLTTVHIPMDELGRMSVKMLIDRIENGKRIPVKIELPFSISVRESCREVNHITRNRS